MTQGRFIAVVGPSGVGKDSVMAGLMARQPGLMAAHRVITRPGDAGGEDFDSVTGAVFAAQVAAGRFALHWGAHGLFYGIPVSVADDLAKGADILANLSRSVLAQAVALFPCMVILCLTARPDTLAARLAGRGRETTADIAERLTRAPPPFPAHVPVVTIANDGLLMDAVTAAHAALYPARQTADRQ